MSVEGKSEAYNFCPRCGKPWQEKANYCSSCGHTKQEAELPESDYLSDKPITLINFFPRLFSAIEHVSLRDFFLMWSTAWILVSQPFSYLEKKQEGKIVPVFTSLMMATFSGIFKCFQDPVYAPWLHKLDMNNEVAETIVQFALYVVLASIFGLFGFLMAKTGYYIFRIKAVSEDRFVRAMLVLYNVFSFVLDSASPFWMILVENGTIPYGSLTVDLFRAMLIFIYVPVIYQGLKKEKVNFEF